MISLRLLVSLFSFILLFSYGVIRAENSYKNNLIVLNEINTSYYDYQPKNTIYILKRVLNLSPGQYFQYQQSWVNTAVFIGLNWALRGNNFRAITLVLHCECNLIQVNIRTSNFYFKSNVYEFHKKNGQIKQSTKQTKNKAFEYTIKLDEILSKNDGLLDLREVSIYVDGDIKDVVHLSPIKSIALLGEGVFFVGPKAPTITERLFPHFRFDPKFVNDFFLLSLFFVARYLIKKILFLISSYFPTFFLRVNASKFDFFLAIFYCFFSFTFGVFSITNLAEIFSIFTYLSLVMGFFYLWRKSLTAQPRLIERHNHV